MKNDIALCNNDTENEKVGVKNDDILVENQTMLDFFSLIEHHRINLKCLQEKIRVVV